MGKNILTKVSDMVLSIGETVVREGDKMIRAVDGAMDSICDTNKSKEMNIMLSRKFPVNTEPKSADGMTAKNTKQEDKRTAMANDLADNKATNIDNHQKVQQEIEEQARNSEFNTSSQEIEISNDEMPSCEEASGEGLNQEDKVDMNESEGESSSESPNKQPQAMDEVTDKNSEDFDKKSDSRFAHEADNAEAQSLEDVVSNDVHEAESRMDIQPLQQERDHQRLEEEKHKMMVNMFEIFAEHFFQTYDKYFEKLYSAVSGKACLTTESTAYLQIMQRLDDLENREKTMAQAVEKVNVAAGKAETSAQTAQEDAYQAKISAGNAQSAIGKAQTLANQAQTAASHAQTDADAAKKAAEDAARKAELAEAHAREASQNTAKALSQGQEILKKITGEKRENEDLIIKWLAGYQNLQNSFLNILRGDRKKLSGEERKVIYDNICVFIRISLLELYGQPIILEDKQKIENETIIPVWEKVKANIQAEIKKFINENDSEKKIVHVFKSYLNKDFAECFIIPRNGEDYDNEFHIAFGNVLPEEGDDDFQIDKTIIPGIWNPQNASSTVKAMVWVKPKMKEIEDMGSQEKNKNEKTVVEQNDTNRNSFHEEQKDKYSVGKATPSGGQNVTYTLENNERYQRKDQSVGQTQVATDYNLENIILTDGVKLDMVKVSAGRFTMGDALDDNAKPRHQVTISKDYWIGKYPFTQELWNILYKSNEYHSQNARMPITEISWFEANDCCERLNMLFKDDLLPIGYQFSLPTEAQWEFAARGGCKTRFYPYSGGYNLNEVGWYKDNTDGKTPQIVGKKKPNELGIYDMSGNVYEWCHDWYGSYTKESIKDPTGPERGQTRVIRGGSVMCDLSSCQLVNRLSGKPNEGYQCLGFRVVIVPIP